MKALVTGATGFIGANLVRALLREGADVRVFIRETSDPRPIAGLDVEIAYGDLRDPESVRRAVAGCQAVYHTAAYVEYWAPDPRVFYETNVDGTRNVLSAALEEGVERVIHTSSFGTIGIPSDGRPVNEDTPFNLWKESQHYEISKCIAEEEALRFHRRGLPVVVVNPTGVVGPYDFRPSAMGRFIVRFARGRVPGYVDGAFNCVDVEDVARGHISAAERGRPGERYILGGEEITMREIVEILSEMTGVPPPRIRIPYPLAWVGANLFEFIAAHWTHKPPTFTKGALCFIGLRKRADSTKAMRELGFSPTPIEESFHKAVKWFLKNGYIPDRTREGRARVRTP
ncbi:MAG: hopanoid-associated sugar epimerase [bacterium]